MRGAASAPTIANAHNMWRSDAGERRLRKCVAIATRANSTADWMSASIISTALRAGAVNSAGDSIDGFARDLGVGHREQRDRRLFGGSAEEGLDEMLHGFGSRRAGGDGWQVDVTRAILAMLRRS